MDGESRFVAIVRERQKAIRRELDRRGIAMKAVSQDSGIPYPTLLTYFPADAHAAPAQIPGGAIYALGEGRAIPTDLLSLLLPAGLAVVEVPEETDLEKLADSFAEFLADKNAAHHPQSEAGREIGPNERARLNAKILHLPIKGVVNG